MGPRPTLGGASTVARASVQLHRLRMRLPPFCSILIFSISFFLSRGCKLLIIFAHYTRRAVYSTSVRPNRISAQDRIIMIGFGNQSDGSDGPLRFGLRVCNFFLQWPGRQLVDWEVCVCVCEWRIPRCSLWRTEDGIDPSFIFLTCL